QSGRTQLRQHRFGPRIDSILVHPGGGETLAVLGDGRIDTRPVVRGQQLRKGILQRRADVGHQRLGRRRLQAELRQRVLHAARDALLGVGQRAIEVEEDRADHAGFPCPASAPASPGTSSVPVNTCKLEPAKSSPMGWKRPPRNSARKASAMALKESQFCGRAKPWPSSGYRTYVTGICFSCMAATIWSDSAC